MRRRFHRVFLAGIMLATFAVAPLMRPYSASSQQAPIVLGTSGHTGQYLLNSDPVDCKYFSSGSLYEISANGPIRVKAYASHNLPTQKVVSTIRLYQRLANDSYQFRSEAPAGSVTAG